MAKYCACHGLTAWNGLTLVSDAPQAGVSVPPAERAAAFGWAVAMTGATGAVVGATVGAAGAVGAVGGADVGADAGGVAGAAGAHA